VTVWVIVTKHCFFYPNVLDKQVGMSVQYETLSLV
jgi:hypothetical protein